MTYYMVPFDPYFDQRWYWNLAINTSLKMDKLHWRKHDDFIRFKALFFKNN